jgi:hypothetical protein
MVQETVHNLGDSCGMAKRATGPSTVGERNDYFNPEVRPAGIDMVWVHGTLVLDHGRLIVPRPFPGRALTSPVHNF